MEKYGKDLQDVLKKCEDMPCSENVPCTEDVPCTKHAKLYCASDGGDFFGKLRFSAL